MSLTKKQRSAVNRQNASHSTGPKSDEGKASSRRNALKHGLRADALALPNEDPSIAASRNASWNDFYQPQSPAAQHLVNQCVQATLLADRCHQFHHAALSKQMRDAETAARQADPARLPKIVRNFPVDPAGTIDQLTDFAAGTRWLIDAWEELSERLDGDNFWSADDCDDAILFQGFHAHKTPLDPAAWLTRLFGLRTDPNVAPASLERLLVPGRVPDEYFDTFSVTKFPDRETCIKRLRDMIDKKLGHLRDLEKELSADEADNAPGLSPILNDPDEARLFLRYHAEARTSFHRAYRELVKTLEMDALNAQEDEPPVEAKAVESPPSPASETVSPNEAKCGASAGTGSGSERFQRLMIELPSTTASTAGDDRHPQQVSAPCAAPLSVE